MTTDEKAIEIVNFILENVKQGNKITFEPDCWGNYSTTITIESDTDGNNTSSHTHVGMDVDTREDVINSIHALFIKGIGLSWHATVKEQKNVS